MTCPVRKMELNIIDNDPSYFNNPNSNKWDKIILKLLNKILVTNLIKIALILFSIIKTIIPFALVPNHRPISRPHDSIDN